MKSKKESAVARRIRSRNITLVIATIIILVILCLFTPLFGITEIYVTGNSILESENVIIASGIQEGDNLFRINTKEAENRINSLGYVEKVEIKRKFLAKIEIQLTEAKETAYVPFSGNYVGINQDGKVLSLRSSKKFTPKKTVISGMAIKSCRKGEYIVSKKEGKLELAKSIMKELSGAQMLDSTVKINIADPKDISLSLNSETVIILGDKEQLDYKIQCVQAVLEKLGDIRGGKINASDPANVVYEGGN